MYWQEKTRCVWSRFAVHWTDFRNFDALTSHGGLLYDGCKIDSVFVATTAGALARVGVTAHCRNDVGPTVAVVADCRNDAGQTAADIALSLDQPALVNMLTSAGSGLWNAVSDRLKSWRGPQVMGSIPILSLFSLSSSLCRHPSVFHPHFIHFLP